MLTAQRQPRKEPQGRAAAGRRVAQRGAGRGQPARGRA